MSTLLILGAGPGVGLSSAKALAGTGKFDSIALCSRNEERLKSEAEQVKESMTGSAKVQVHTFGLDLNDFEALRNTIEKVLLLGRIDTVLFNAARIKDGPPLQADVRELEEDFRAANLALYVAAQLLFPKLIERSESSSKPSFIVTNSHLPENPEPNVLILSVVKAAQQNMMQGFHAAFGEKIDFAVVKIRGTVGYEEGHIRPEKIAQQIVQVVERASKGHRGELLIAVDP